MARAHSILDAGGRTWDAVVIGAGVAGTLAARELARRGAAVLLVDKAAWPRWKVCGACLNPLAQSVLAAVDLGDVLHRCGAVPARRLRLRSQGGQADIPLSGWQVLSRARLDGALAEAAVEAGACFLPATLASLGPATPDDRVVYLRQGEQVQGVVTRLVVAADGLGHRLGDGAETLAPAARIGAGVMVDAAPDYYEPGVIFMAYGSAGYLGLVRLEDGRLNLGAALNAIDLRSTRNPGALAAALLDQCRWPAIPGLAELPWRGTPALTRRCRRPADHRLLVIGDAAGYVEPFTGEGMSWAMAAGASVAGLVARGGVEWRPRWVEGWMARQRQHAIAQRRLCRGLAWLSRYPMLATALIGILGVLPILAAPLVPGVRTQER